MKSALDYNPQFWGEKKWNPRVIFELIGYANFITVKIKIPALALIEKIQVLWFLWGKFASDIYHFFCFSYSRRYATYDVVILSIYYLVAIHTINLPQNIYTIHTVYTNYYPYCLYCPVSILSIRMHTLQLIHSVSTLSILSSIHPILIFILSTLSIPPTLSILSSMNQPYLS